MIGTVEAINLIMNAAAMLLMIIALASVLLSRKTGLLKGPFLLIMFALLTAYVTSSMIELISEYLLHNAFLSQLTMFLQSFFSSVLTVALTVYILHSAGKDDYFKDPYLIAALILWAVYFILLIVTQFTKNIYYFTPDSVYHRGPAYPLLLVPPILILLLNLLLLYNLRKQLSSRQLTAFSVYLVLPMIAMLIQIAFYGLLLIVFATSIAAGIMYVLLLYDQVKLQIMNAEDLAAQRASIAVLQMRPHFIYNTMMSIYYLCGQDPEKARQVTLNFTSYLRKNFSAIANTQTVPFTEELEHTRAYLAVEQVRFEGKLFVEFDTPHSMFRLPALTLQPVVENAVKHGVDPELEPICITVRTRKTESGSLVTVEDNGPGFAVTDNDEPHVALANTRERLALMCNGTIEISSREEGGTIVSIFIPDKPEKKQRGG